MRDFDKGKKFGKSGGSNYGNKSYGGDRGEKRYGDDRGERKSYSRGGGYGGGGYGGGRGNDRPQMHSATCGDCGKSCEVPFRPTGEKPVFCNDCFRSGKDSGRSGGFSDRGKRDFDSRPARPRFEDKKPYGGDAGKESINYKAQFEILNTKLDKILKAMTIATQGKEITVKEEKVSVKKEVEEKPNKKTLTKKTEKVEAKKKEETKKDTVKNPATKKTVAKKKK